MSRLCFSPPTPLPRFHSLSSSATKMNAIPSSISFVGPSRCLSRSQGVDRRNQRTAATLTANSHTTGEESLETDTQRVLLEVRDLTAVVAESRQEILRGVNLIINEGEVHAIMGKNGSGKSTFAKVLVGHPDYEVTGGTVSFKGMDLLNMEPEMRSHAGVFLSFQTPVEIPGVSNMDFLLMACNARREKRGERPLSPIEFFGFLSPKLAAVNMNPKFLDRNVNEGFSGGEKKRNEILQLAVLEAELAILDEIDSGLDVDALQDVAKAVNGLLAPHKSLLMITHYQRLLDYIKPSYVHIMEAGAIVRTGNISLSKQLEKEGYRGIYAA